MNRKMSPKTQIFLLQLFLALSVSAAVELKKEKKMYLPTSDAQKAYVVQGVCADLDWYFNSDAGAIDKCIKDFKWDMDQDQSGLQIRCRSNSSVTFEVAPSTSYQVVLLVPDPSDDNDPYSVIYSTVMPNTKFPAISFTESTNYKVFSTVLDKHGTPLVWHYEYGIYNWHTLENRKYDIQVKFQYNNSDSINGWFTWNRTGELDSCFELMTTCQKSEMKSVQIWPDSPPSIKVEGLPVNDSCHSLLIGMYGRTTYEFNTNGTEMPNFTYPKEVKLAVEEDGTSSWTVSVWWPKPVLAPDAYNVTLRADVITSIIVDGNATEAIFRDITGHGFFNVSVYALLGNDVAHNSAQAMFPNRTEWRWVGAAGGAWGVVGVGAVLAALCWLRLRRRSVVDSENSQSLPSNESKLLEEGAFDSIGVESSDEWEVKSERLLLHEVIGEGAFGVVRRGTLAPTGKEVAVKMLKDFPTVEERRAFRLEMEVMKSVGAHAHVVSLLGCCGGRRPRIIAEYCSRGDLLSFLRYSWDVMVSKRNAKYYNNNIDTSDYRNDLFKWKLPQEHSKLVINKMYDLQGVCDTELTSLDLLSFCRQIAMGMEFLAANRLVHRDLAARNILVTGDKTLKIADFGLSRDVYEENQYKQKGNGKMPVKWMALESLTRRIYTTQSDVWSFGVVVWEVATVGGAPYPGVPAARLPRLLRAGYRMPRPPNCSKQLYEVMQSCWRARPRERPTFSQLHARLDELLNCACADEYLSLELDDEPPPPPAPRAQRYFRMIIRAKKNWTRGETYERPLKATHNHYTSPPVTITKLPV